MSAVFNNVLAAVDGSVISRQVADFARGLSALAGARLFVLHVVEPPADELAGSLGLAPSALRAQLLARGQALLRDLCRDAGVPEAEQTVQMGTPASTICHEAEICGADLIVVGSHGAGGSRILLGSVGGRVAALASRPVAIVR